ncbi:MAG: ATP-binding cassette domain-containing protein, partial [Pseudomonadota bacterium]
MLEPAVRLRGVAQTFPGGIAALGPIDIDIQSGARIGLLGPSGCGKSTALRAVAGLRRPTSGAISYDAPPEPGDIGFVFQDPVLPPWSRVRDAVAMPLRLLGREVDRNQIDDALRLVGLGDFADAYPRQLSGGMRMRASLARAV